MRIVRMQNGCRTLLAISVVSSAWLCCVQSAGSAEKIAVAAKGQRLAIIKPAGWKQSAWYDWGAHAILERYIHQITGVKAEIFSADNFDAAKKDAFSTRIWVSRQPEVEKVFGAELQKIDDDGFMFRVRGNDIYLAGKFWWGDNWAAHDLLERFAGCRWYGPEMEFWKPEKGTVGLFDIIPASERIEVPSDASITEEPSYRMRWYRFMPLHAFRLRYRDSFHHAFEQLLPFEKYGAEHPEYYPLVRGERRVPKSKKDGQQFQPCASNEEVVKIISQAAIEHFKAKPESGTFSIGMNDTNVFCECDRCMAIAPPVLTSREARIAYSFFDYYNRVAERVAAVYPDKRLGCLAYAGLSVLPARSIQLHPMIVPYLTRDSAQLFDADQVKEFRETVDAWKSLAQRMGIYEYVYGGGFVVPRFYDRYLLKNIGERYGVGVDGFYGESYPNWGLDGPKYWLLSRMLWNHKQNPDALMDQYCGDLFGAASAAMRAYFNCLEETWCSQTLQSPRSNYRWFQDSKQLEIFSPAACEKAWALLEKAEREAESDRVRERVRWFKHSFALTRALSARYHAASALDAQNQSNKGALTPEWLSAFDRYLHAPELKQVLDNIPAGALDREVNKDLLRYDREPVDAVSAQIQQIAKTAIAQAVPANQATYLKQLEEVVPQNTQAANALKTLAAKAVIWISEVATPPEIDGAVEVASFTETKTTSQFHKVHRLQADNEKTTVIAATSGAQLYLAFDLEQHPETISGVVNQRDLSGWQNPAMVYDDCVCITFKHAPTSTLSVRINCNGAIGASDPKWDGVMKGAARKTEQGWQAELLIDLAKTGIQKESTNSYALAIARYTRRQEAPVAGKPAVFRTEVSTLLPAGHGEGIIGRGNHPQLMTFLTGPRIQFIRPATPAR